MSSKDRDIYKLRKYANKLGLRVYVQEYSRHTGAAEYVAGESITIFVSKTTTKTDIILSFLHELGHHLDWINGGKLTKTEKEALLMLNSGAMTGKRSDLNAKYRKAIYEIEKAGIKYMAVIHKKLKLEIPFYKVKHQQELDLFEYSFLYKHGRFSTRNELYRFYKRNKTKYLRKYGKRKKSRNK